MSYRYIAQRLWYIRKVSQALSNDDAKGNAPFDKVMIENHATLFMTMQKHDNAERYAGKVYYHLHNEVTNDFGCKHEIAQIKKVLGVSNYIVETLDKFLREHGEGGLKLEQKAVWRNGIDTSRFGSDEAKRKAEDFRMKYGIGDDDIVFLFSGRLTPEKGAEELLEAFTQVADQIPHAKLVVAGAFFFNSNIKSPFEQKLHDLTLQPQVEGKIVFTGFIDYNDMPSLYEIADVCVLPSIWNEPAGLTIIESLASGKPLITTNSGGIPEYALCDGSFVVPRDDQLVSNLAKHMLQLGTDSELRSKMGEAAYKQGHHFSESFYFDELCKVLG